MASTSRAFIAASPSAWSCWSLRAEICEIRAYILCASAWMLSFAGSVSSSDRIPKAPPKPLKKNMIRRANSCSSRSLLSSLSARPKRKRCLARDGISLDSNTPALSSSTMTTLVFAKVAKVFPSTTIRLKPATSKSLTISMILDLGSEVISSSSLASTLTGGPTLSLTFMAFHLLKHLTQKAKVRFCKTLNSRAGSPYSTICQ
mmetsp:Transcript_95256/g.171974  ORF Transcript_95256/g.171974 Transcript_95256/m.171974 type:complete len:203 (+) Transcript_95256:297-905(+)